MSQDNMIKLLDQVRNGRTSSTVFKKWFQKKTGSDLLMLWDRQFPTGRNKAYFADLFKQHLILTTHHRGFHIFNIEFDSILLKAFRSWLERDFSPNIFIGAPRASWGEDASFILCTGYGHKLEVLDGESLSQIESVSFRNQSDSHNRWGIMQHEVCPLSNKLVAVACSNGRTPLVDLRTGNVESVISGNITHLNGLCWSRFYENVICISTSNSVQLWDTRRLNRHFIHIHYPSRIPQSMVFFDRFRLLTYRDVSFDCIDLPKEEITFSFPINEGMPFRKRRRRHFALNSYDFPQLAYVPSGPYINIVDLKEQFIITTKELPLFPASVVTVNEALQEVYTFSSYEKVIWKQSLQHFH